MKGEFSVDNVMDQAVQNQLLQLREALYQAYDAGNQEMVYRMSRCIDQLQLRQLEPEADGK